MKSNHLFYSLLILVISLAACVKKTDDHVTDTTDRVAPELSITAPTNGAQLTLGNVAVMGSTSDNDDLHDLHLGLNETGSTTEIWAADPTVHELKSYVISSTIPSAKLAAGKSYVLTAVSEDHNGNKKTITVQFSVKP